MKLLAANRRATYDYELHERILAGLVLQGAEVKSIKAGHASLKGAFIMLRRGEAFLTSAHVTPYGPAGNHAKYDPTRHRKLLLHQRQLAQLISQKQAGLSVIPIALLLDRQLIKLEIGIGRGKKRYDKRQVIKQRDISRDLARALKI